jgi:hypothetical protein
MSEDSQIVVPQSFVDLFVPSGRLRPIATAAEVAARYEVCEDLASLLTEHAKTVLWDFGITEEDVLRKIHAGLLEAGSAVTPSEAWWVTHRLAELLGWTWGSQRP